MPSIECAVIVGGSHAAAQLAPSLRQEGWEGRILIVSDDSRLPYHRPPLSKDYLSGEAEASKLLIRPEEFYARQAIEFRLNTRVEGIDREIRRIRLSDGDTLSYTKLALCTGARVRRLDIAGAELPGVHYLRDLADAEKIKQDTKPGGRAVILGGGYIGLETAALLRKIGLEVCVLESVGRVLQRVTSEEVSRFYTRVHSEEGVEIKTNVMATEIVGADHVEAVVCNTGERIEADLVIIGIGVIPNTELAETCGLNVNNGIVVDERARTSDVHIVAAGDCANHPSLIYQRNIRLESVPNATEQAKAAAASICSKEKPHLSLPWFWSNQYDLKLQIAGLNEGFDSVAIRGDIDNSRSFVAWYLKEGRVLAADCVNRPAEFMLARKMIPCEKHLPIELLADDEINVKDLVAKLKG